MDAIRYSPGPVPERPEDLSRYVDYELRSIRDSIVAVGAVLGRLEAIATEEAILRGSTTLTSTTLTNYPASYKPQPPVLSQDPQTITLDATAGTITIGEEGVYTIDGYVAQSAGNNNSNYAWAVMKNGVTELVLGTTVWAQQASAYVFNAHADFALDAGDVLRIDTIDTLTGITVLASNFVVSMRTSPDIEQAGLRVQVWNY